MDLKTYCKDTFIKIMWYMYKYRKTDLQNITKRIEIDSLILKFKATRGEMTAFLTNDARQLDTWIQRKIKP